MFYFREHASLGNRFFHHACVHCASAKVSVPVAACAHVLRQVVQLCRYAMFRFGGNESFAMYICSFSSHMFIILNARRFSGSVLFYFCF